MTAISTLHLVFWASQCLMLYAIGLIGSLTIILDLFVWKLIIFILILHDKLTTQVTCVSQQAFCAQYGQSCMYRLCCITCLDTYAGRGGVGESFLPGIELQFCSYSASSLISILNALYQLFSISMDLIVINFTVSYKVYCNIFCSVLFIIDYTAYRMKHNLMFYQQRNICTCSINEPMHRTNL
jgi:hypothetical protein